MTEVLFRVEGLAKRFAGGYEALSGVDLELREGEFVVLAGSNGSGKTQLMRALVGLMEPSSGRVLYKGRPVLDDPYAVRAEAGLVFQDADAQIVGETVLEDAEFGPRNLGFPAHERDARVKSALEAMGLEGKADAPPRRLSGGEKRRLAVAGILAMGCSCVIMDEPFANLDWPGVVGVLEAAAALKKDGKTVVVLTHELEKVLALADRLVILDRGAVRDDGKPGVVLDRGVERWGIRDPRQSYRDAGDCSWLK